MRRFLGVLLAFLLAANPVLATSILTTGAGKAASGGGSFTSFLGPTGSGHTSANVNLTGSNLIFTANAGGDGITCSAAPITATKTWSEFKLLATAGAGPWVGYTNGVGGYSTGAWAGSSLGMGGAYTNAALWNETSNLGLGYASIINISVNAYLMILFDKTATTYTCCGTGSAPNGVFWYRSAGGDTDTIPLPSGTVYICGGTGSSGDSMSANFGQAVPNNSIPVGYLTP